MFSVEKNKLMLLSCFFLYFCLKQTKTMKKLFFGLIAVAALSFTSCKDECKDVNCSNGGTCEEGICSCPSGYQGDLCETSWASLFQGNYNVNEQFTIVSSDSTGSDSFGSQISTGTDPKKITISNFSNSGQSITADLESASSLKITSQTVTYSGNQLSANGTGSISGSTVTLNYSLAIGGVVVITATDTFTRL
jgi:hypothetical protein